MLEIGIKRWFVTLCFQKNPLCSKQARRETHKSVKGNKTPNYVSVLCSFRIINHRKMLTELYIFSGHLKSYIFNSCHVFNKVKKSTNQDEEHFKNAQTFHVLVTNSTACGTAITHTLNRNIYQVPNHVANYNEYYFMQNVPNISPNLYSTP